MTVITLMRSEFARLTSSRMGITALVALMTVPVVYGGLYLWGNADPYSRLNHVPAAIVVDDAGATIDGTAVNYGRDAAAQLLASARFDWHVVSDATAAAGVRSGAYDFSMTFPSSFSADLGSAGGAAGSTGGGTTTPTAKPASIVLSTNDVNSYLSTTIAKQAAETVRASVAAQVGQSASLVLLEGIDSVRTGVVSAASGATSVATGAASAAAGAATLSSGSASLASGSAALSTGLGQLQSNAATLPASAATLAGGAAQVSNGLSSAAVVGAGLAAGTSQSAAAASTARSDIAAALQGSNIGSSTQATLLAELDGLVSQTSANTTSAAGLSAALNASASGAAQVATGAGALSASAPALSAAIANAASGAASLASGASSEASGAAQLDSGLAQLSSGAAQLRDGLNGAQASIPATTDAGRASTAAAIADPVEVDQRAITTAQNYGAGLAPFFIALASWIGIYALFLLVRPLSRRALTAVRRPIATTIAGWLTPALLGAVQMLALFLVVTLALGLHPANPLGMLAFMLLVAATFAAIVLALNVWLGSVGQFLALVLMVVQLVTAGGTFPWQTLPAPLAALHEALPMSHAVEGIRQLLYGPTPAALLSAIGQLLIWMLAALAIAALGANKQGRFRTLRELRPSPLAG